MQTFTFECKQSKRTINVKAKNALEAMGKANKRLWKVWGKNDIQFYGWFGSGTTYRASYGVWD